MFKETLDLWQAFFYCYFYKVKYYFAMRNKKPMVQSLEHAL
tara:strand:- start:215 stop:337 length:123 start_codon:yes stop_codon:yes gene_type:complete